MGIKMIPITERVNKGLFNQKKADKFSNEGVQEPLLNVGPAGVYGDNITRDTPSPAKKGYKMSSPLHKESAKQERKNLMDDMPVDKVASSVAKKKNVTASSPAKQTSASAGDIVTGTAPSTIKVDPIPGEDQTISGKTDYVHEGKKDKNWAKTREGICNGTIKGDKSKVNCPDTVVKGKDKCPEGSTGTPPNCEKVVPGNLQGQKTVNTGGFVKPWEARMNDRTRKINANRLNTANKTQIKLKDRLASRYDGYGTEGFVSPKPGEKDYKNFSNLKRRLENAQNDGASYTQGLYNAERQIEQNLANYGQGGVQGINNPDEVTARVANVNSNNKGSSVSEEQIAARNRAAGSPANKGFFNKKSPMKLKYFK